MMMSVDVVVLPLVATRILLDIPIIDRKRAVGLENERYCATCLEYKWAVRDAFRECNHTVVPSDETVQFDRLCRAPISWATVPC